MNAVGMLMTHNWAVNQAGTAITHENITNKYIMKYLPGMRAQANRVCDLMLELAGQKPLSARNEALLLEAGIKGDEIRLVQLGESHISNAQRSVHERAAKYLGIPVVLVQALAQSITLSDLFWPDEENFERRVETGIEDLFADPFLGGFVPPVLRSATPPVKMFVLFLYRELNVSGTSRPEPGTASWLRPVREVLSSL